MGIVLGLALNKKWGLMVERDIPIEKSEIKSELIINELEGEQLEKLIRKIYREILNSFGMNEILETMYVGTLMNHRMIDVKGKTNREILIEMRENVLELFKTGIDLFLFGEVLDEQ